MQYIVISVIGTHAGESTEQIFKRKVDDISNVGKTFWLIHSYKAKPAMVQSLCVEAESQNQDALAIFVEASSAMGAVPTRTTERAGTYSKDSTHWEILPENLSPVTGKIDTGAFALVFNQLELANGDLDLWDYADFSNKDQPVKIRQGASSVCALRKDMGNHPDRMKSRNRRIIAIGIFCDPYCVWLR